MGNIFSFDGIGKKSSGKKNPDVFGKSDVFSKKPQTGKAMQNGMFVQGNKQMMKELGLMK